MTHTVLEAESTDKSSGQGAVLGVRSQGSTCGEKEDKNWGWEDQTLLYLLCDPGQVTCPLWDTAGRDLLSPLEKCWMSMCIFLDTFPSGCVTLVFKPCEDAPAPQAKPNLLSTAPAPVPLRVLLQALPAQTEKRDETLRLPTLTPALVATVGGQHLVTEPRVRVLALLPSNCVTLRMFLNLSAPPCLEPALHKFQLLLLPSHSNRCTFHSNSEERLSRGGHWGSLTDSVAMRKIRVAISKMDRFPFHLQPAGRLSIPPPSTGRLHSPSEMTTEL